MNFTVLPGPRRGSVTVPASKSQAHRLLICAALGEGETLLRCDGISGDIEATLRCLRAMGAETEESGGEIRLRAIGELPAGEVTLPCGESGSTLRFLLPAVGALGLRAVFRMEGKLPQRPMEALYRALRAQGMELRQEGALLHAAGRLRPGTFTLPGNVSSQYISGLLMALPRLAGDSTLRVTGPLESADYIAMTEDALQKSGIRFEKTGQDYRIPGLQRPRLPRVLIVERDWSGAAFFLALGALSEGGVTVRGMDPASRQGDRRILRLLADFGAEAAEEAGSITLRRDRLRGQIIDASQIPDLVPVLSVVAAGAEGITRIEHAERLRLKESDRLETTAAMLSALGAEIRVTEDGLLIRGRSRLRGGTAEAAGDHRIAMSAAVAAALCEENVTVRGAECVAKSYPRFWEDLENLEVMT